MANKKITDLPILTDLSDDDWFYVVDVSDLTESGDGTSKKVKQLKTDSTKLAILNNLSDLDDASIARTNLGLGTLATQSGTFADKYDASNPSNYQTLGEVLSRIDDAIQDIPYDETIWDGATEDAPSMNSVRDKFVSVDANIAGKQDDLGFTAENVANKENTTLDTSTTKYPTNNLVKTVTDLKANLASPTFTGSVQVPNGSASTEAVNKRQLDLKANSINTIQSIETLSTRTLVLSDASTIIPFSNNIGTTLTVPTNTSVAFPIGTSIGIYALSAPINISGAGVTFIGNDISINNGDLVTLLKTGVNTWILQGTLKSTPLFTGTVRSNDSARAFRSNGNGSFCFSDGITGMKLINGGMAFDAWTSTPTGNVFSFLIEYYSNISGNTNVLNFSDTFNPTSGTGTTNVFNLSPTINQTGGANGVTRGLYINPTLTSAFDFRAIEVTAGKVIIPDGTASNEAVNKGQLESGFVAKGVDNATTVVLSSATLNSTYPSATTGFRVYCASIIVGAMTYEKTPTGWLGFTCIVP